MARVNVLDLVVYKICTWSLSHRRMIENLPANGKPLVFETGTITRMDLLQLEAVYKKAGGGEPVVLHDFHTSNEDEMNFRAFEVYRQLGLVAGCTPQGRSDWLDYMSVGMGATILEKRLTTSRDIPESGYWRDHEPEEFADWIKNIGRSEAALGNPVISPTRQDMKETEKYYKSAYHLRDVRSGEVIRQEDLELKRPGTGVSSCDVTEQFVGRPYTHDYKAGELLEPA